MAVAGGVVVIFVGFCWRFVGCRRGPVGDGYSDAVLFEKLARLVIFFDDALGVGRYVVNGVDGSYLLRRRAVCLMMLLLLFRLKLV